jgi:hypothetical protein
MMESNYPEDWIFTGEYQVVFDPFDGAGWNCDGWGLENARSSSEEAAQQLIDETILSSGDLEGAEKCRWGWSEIMKDPDTDREDILIGHVHCHYEPPDPDPDDSDDELTAG